MGGERQGRVPATRLAGSQHLERAAAVVNGMADR